MAQMRNIDKSTRARAELRACTQRQSRDIEFLLKRFMKTIIPYVVFSSLATLNIPVCAQQVQSLYESVQSFEDIRRAGTTRANLVSQPSANNEDFGATVIQETGDQPKLTLGASADATWLFTDNVLFTKSGRKVDSFLAATAGVNARYAMSPGWEADTAIRGGLFRFDKIGALDFQNIDFHCGLTLAPSRMRGTALYARYNFTELAANHSGDVFYTNHAITLGAQRAFSFSRAHGITLGVSGQWAVTDPSDVQRDDYSAYVGYRLRVARDFTADLFYRMNYFVYRESGDDRRDLRNSLSLNLRYEFNPNVAVSTIGYYSFNESNRDFDYRVGNLGATAGFEARF